MTTDDLENTSPQHSEQKRTDWVFVIGILLFPLLLLGLLWLGMIVFAAGMVD